METAGTTIQSGVRMTLGQARRERRDERREHHDGEAEQHERFARAESAHHGQTSIIAAVPARRLMFVEQEAEPVL